MFHTFNLRRNRFVVLLALCMLFALALPVSADQADPNSATPPHEMLERAPVEALAPDAPLAPATVLLLKDVNPWSSTANEQILTANGISYVVMGSAGIPAVDLNQYPVVIVAGDQPTSFYSVLDANEAKFNAYAMAGGMLQFSIAGWGWNSGDPSSVMLPGGASIHPQYDGYNYLTMPGHPVVAGVSNPFYGSSASHAYLAGFPGGASVIATAGSEPGGAPTLVEYSYGNGCVLALGQPLEYGYEYGQASGTILKNAILHSVYSPCGGGPVPVGGRLFGWLFIDADEDGWRDVGENEGLPLVLVQLRRGDGTLVQETYSTLPRGWYEFNGIEAGSYCLRIAVPEDYVTTTPSEACFTFDGANLNVNFGLVKAQAGIGDTVFADANANGVQDAGEMGYAGVTLALWSEAAGAPGAVIATTTTDADGTYHFIVTPGAYFVQVTDTANVLAGLSLTAGTNPAGPITVGLNEQNLDIDFGYGFACPANRSVLSGRVWEDLNGDSLLDAGDTGIAGVQVCAQPLSQAYAARCTTTGADGMYRMCVRPMSYLVAPVVDATSPVHGLMPINKAFRLPVGIKPGMQVTDINFGFTRFTPVQ